MKLFVIVILILLFPLFLVIAVTSKILKIIQDLLGIFMDFYVDVSEILIK